ncbi:hypothetical protein JW877_00950 [bacterium]|nr:hypothetical protein [bacterium]
MIPVFSPRALRGNHENLTSILNWVFPETPQIHPKFQRTELNKRTPAFKLNYCDFRHEEKQQIKNLFLYKIRLIYILIGTYFGQYNKQDCGKNMLLRIVTVKTYSEEESNLKQFRITYLINL